MAREALEVKEKSCARATRLTRSVAVVDLGAGHTVAAHEPWRSARSTGTGAACGSMLMEAEWGLGMAAQATMHVTTGYSAQLGAASG